MAVLAWVATLLLALVLAPSAPWANPAGTSEDARNAQARRGVDCVQSKDFACGVELLEPLRDSTEDSLEQASIHFALARAYEGAGRGLDAVGMYLAGSMMPAMPAAYRAQCEASLDVLLDPESPVVDVRAPHTVEALRHLVLRRAPPSRWHARLDFVRALALAEARDYDDAVRVFDRLAQNEAAGKALARRAGRMAEALRAQHPATLSVPCRGDDEVYFAVQPLDGRAAEAPPGQAGEGEGCPQCWRRCSADPVVVAPGQHTVVVWRRGPDGMRDGAVPFQQAVVARRAQPLHLDYVLAPPPPKVERFSLTGVVIGGGLVAVGAISNVIAATASGDASPAKATAALGYGAGLALLIGEGIRWAIDGRDAASAPAPSR